MQVRAELKALFTADCIRRIATEVLLPWLFQRLSAASHATEVPPLPSVICVQVAFAIET